MESEQLLPYILLFRLKLPSEKSNKFSTLVILSLIRNLLLFKLKPFSIHLLSTLNVDCISHSNTSFFSSTGSTLTSFSLFNLYIIICIYNTD